MKKQIVLIISILSVLSVNAQTSFTLNEAVDYALQHNRALKKSKLELQAAESAFKATRSGWLPQVDADIDYMTFFGSEMELNLGGGGAAPTFTNEQLTAAAKSAAEAATNAGGTFNLAQHVGGSAYDAALQSSMPASAIEMKNTSTLKLQASQVIFSGQLLMGIKAAKTGIALVEKGLINSELETKAYVANAYYSVLIVEKTLDIIDNNLKNIESLMKKTEALYKAGVVEQTDVDQLRIQVNTLQNTKLSMERTVDVTYNLLKFQLGLDIEEGLVLSSDLDSIVISAQADTIQNLMFDVATNTTYQLLEQQVELSKKMVNMEKMAYMPTLAAFYSYNGKIIKPEFDMTPKNTAGLALNIPIFSGFTRKNNVDKAKIELLQTQTDKDMVTEQLLMQEKQLRSDLISKYEEYSLQKENVEVSKRVYDSYQVKFSQGVASAMDLTQANTNYLQAESSCLQSILSLLQSKTEFSKLLNTL